LFEKIKVIAIIYECVLTYVKFCRKKGAQQKHVAYIFETSLTRVRFVLEFFGMIYG